MRKCKIKLFKTEKIVALESNCEFNYISDEVICELPPITTECKLCLGKGSKKKKAWKFPYFR